MGERTTTFTDDTWAQEVLESTTPVLVSFWAEWCAPCRMMAPVIEALAHQFDGRAKIGKLNVDENPETADRYNIRGMPTTMVFKNGELLEQVVGVTSQEDLGQLIEPHLDGAGETETKVK